MATLIGIKYIGKKTHPQKDSVAGTGLFWHDTEEVHFVSAEAAAKLLVHTDVWAKAGEKEGADVPAAPVEAPKKELEREEPPLVLLDQMDRQALTVYAQQHFGQKLAHNMSEKNMRIRIQNWMNSPMAQGQ